MPQLSNMPTSGYGAIQMPYGVPTSSAPGGTVPLPLSQADPNAPNSASVVDPTMSVMQSMMAAQYRKSGLNQLSPSAMSNAMAFQKRTQ